MDSLYYLIKRLSHFQKKYPHRPRYCALRMVITSVHALFMSSYTGTKKLFYRKNQVPCIVFSISGGLGDFLLGLNLVYHVYLYLMDSPVQIKIHFHSSIVLKSFCKNMPWIAQSSTSLRSLHGDLLVEIRNFPCIINMDKKKVKNYGVKLQKLISLWKNFYIHNRKYFDYSPQLDSLGHIHGQISGSKRINEGDIGGLLNMNETYKLHIPITLNEEEVLKKYCLSGKKFITFQRGLGTFDEGTINTKLWPAKYYDKLTETIKMHFPLLITVQLGTDRLGVNNDFKYIDINLRGKTNLEELTVLLKHAALHIDCEGGLVHLRHALKGGPSVVLFGPTSPEVYGYSENLNIRSQACPTPCEWVTNDWLTRCPRRHEKHICMESLTPQDVFSRMEIFLKEIYKN